MAISAKDALAKIHAKTKASYESKGIKTQAQADAEKKSSSSSSSSKSTSSSSSNSGKSSGGSYNPINQNSPIFTTPMVPQPTVPNVSNGGYNTFSQTNIGGINTSGISDYQISEIMRKAQSGESLMKSTPEKDALYNYYKNLNNSSSSSSGGTNPYNTYSQKNIGGIDTSGISDYQISEIMKKAASGQQLMSSEGTKGQLYDYYRSMFDYSPVQRSGDVTAGIGQQIDPRANWDWNQVQEINNEILKLKARSAAGDYTAGQQAQQLRDQLASMGVSSEYILPTNMGFEDAVNWVNNNVEGQASQWVNAPNTPMSEAMIQDYLAQQQQIMNPEAELYEQYQRLAEEQANQWYNEQKNSLESLINQLQNQQSSQLMGITNGIQDSTEALEDTAFQDWMAARQAMADRGLAGSGLASDQDTRLLLAKQKNLAGIYRDAERQQFDVNSQMGQSLEDVYRQISNLSKSDKQSELFQQMFGEAQKNMVEQSKTYADMLKEIMGYDLVPATEQAKLDQEWAKWQGDNLMEKYKTDQNFQLEMIGLGLREREIGISQLKADRDYSVAMSQQMGYLVGADGKPVLDSTGKMIPTVEKMRLDETVRNNLANNSLEQGKLNETIRKNMAGEQYDYDKLAAQVTQWTQQNKFKAEDLRISNEELALKISKDTAIVAEMSQNATTQQQKIQIDAIGKSLDSINREIEAIRKNGGDIPQDLMNQRNTLIDQLNQVANGNISSSSGNNLDFLP